MFKIVEKYQTGDGVTHSTKAKAAAHVETMILETLENAMKTAKTYKKGRITSADIFELVQALYDDREAIREALKLEIFGADDKDDDGEH